MRNGLILIIASAALSLGCGDETNPCGDRPLGPGEHQITLDAGGRERRFVLSLPAEIADGPVPLILGYHGVLSRPDLFDPVTELSARGTAAGFAVVLGEGVEQSWNAGGCCRPATTLQVDDVAFTRAVVERVTADACIDRSRVFATGFSNGGAMVFRAVCEVRDVFAAAAQSSGGVVHDCVQERPIPFLSIHGEADPVIPLVVGEASLGYAARVNSCGPGRESSQPTPSVSCQTATGCAEGVETSFCAVAGIGHIWAGGAQDPQGSWSATDEILDFFERAAPCGSCARAAEG